MSNRTRYYRQHHCGRRSDEVDVTGAIYAREGRPTQIHLTRLLDICYHAGRLRFTHIEGNSYLESDHLGNLLVLQRNVNGVTLEDRQRLEVTSEINLGEQVNKIASFHVEASATAKVIPHAFLATVGLTSCLINFTNNYIRLKDQSTSSLPLLRNIRTC